ncbi:MAG: cytochrome c family protein [Rhodobacteraceae bacterium]|jgi:cytochrome c|nr:cytochrome c family protein [Paracoccaceae bacterium]
MFDTMTVTKAVGGVCGALLIYLLADWAATAVYSMDTSSHGGDGAPEQAYVIATDSDAPAAEAEAAAPVDVAALMAAADPAAGEKVFGKCKACHKLDGKNGTGPHLDGVVDRPIASIADFKYSTSMEEHKGTNWTPEVLFQFLESPKGFASNTKMSFAGLPKPEDRANVIAYLAASN